MTATGLGTAGEGVRGARDATTAWSRPLLAAALVLGLVRFYRLGEWSLWIDEALALSDSLHGGEFSNPLGYWLFRILFEVWPTRPDELALRLLPAVLGWASIPLTYWVFRPFAGARASAVAALLVSISSWHVYWSQTARFYTLALDLSLLGAGFLLRGLWSDSPARLVTGFVVAGCAALAHPSAATLLPALILAPSLLRLCGHPIPELSARCRTLLVTLTALSILGAVPWASDIWERWQRAKGGGTPVHFILTVGFHFTPLLGAGALVGAVMAWRRRAAFDALALAVVALVIGGWIVISVFARASAQYVFYLLPWMAVLAASPLGAQDGARDGHPSERAGGAAPGSVGRSMQAAYLVLLALPLFADTALYFSARGGLRPRWRDAYRFVWDRLEPGDLIMGMEAPVGEYYLSPGSTHVRYQQHVTYLNNVHPEWIELWTQRERRTWFVVNFDQLDDWPPYQRHDFERLLREECRLAGRFPLETEGRDLSVSVFLRP